MRSRDEGEWMCGTCVRGSRESTRETEAGKEEVR